MTRIVLARHGESVWHREDRYAGSSDIDLTLRGREQARELAVWAQLQGFSAIWASPLKRARETAMAVADTTGLAVRFDDRLVEQDFGTAEGVSRASLERDRPVEYAAFIADPVAHPWAGGDDPHQVASRMAAVLQDLAEGHPDQRVLVVAHATAFRLGLCALIGVELPRYRTLFPRLTNGSVSEIQIVDQAPGLLALNVPIGAHGDAA